MSLYGKDATERELDGDPPPTDAEVIAQARDREQKDYSPEEWVALLDCLESLDAANPELYAVLVAYGKALALLRGGKP